MKDIWFISDHHFFDEEVLTYKNSKGERIRPLFANLGEMHEYMLEKWNSVVKPGDRVYHLGDVFHTGKRENYEPFVDLWSKLHGDKTLILGNHDLDIGLFWNGKDKSGKRLVKSVYSCIRKLPEFGLQLSHIPVQRESNYHYKSGGYLENVHGHIHVNLVPEPGYINVCVEQVDYTPVHLDTIRKK